jgi:hypothetical protein
MLQVRIVAGSILEAVVVYFDLSNFFTTSNPGVASWIPRIFLEVGLSKVKGDNFTDICEAIV